MSIPEMMLAGGRCAFISFWYCGSGERTSSSRATVRVATCRLQTVLEPSCLSGRQIVSLLLPLSQQALLKWYMGMLVFVLLL